MMANAMKMEWKRKTLGTQGLGLKQVIPPLLSINQGSIDHKSLHKFIVMERILQGQG